MCGKAEQHRVQHVFLEQCVRKSSEEILHNMGAIVFVRLQQFLGIAT